ncbi:MAG: DUF3891 family protein [Deltaproteobacteria bacterium]|nr:DUF3891 family protein [Deltaproteobacteria bacterium]
MIRREKNNGWILITQYDHAGLAGQVMTHWGNGEFAKPAPYDEVLFALREHDSGWKEWDSMPKINPETGYPANFTEMSPHEQYEIWSRCYKLYAATHLYASCLIALHFSKFNQSNIRKNPDLELPKSLQNDMMRFVAEKLDIDVSNVSLEKIPDEVRTNLKLLQIGDIISLTLCHGWRSIEITEAPFDYNGSETTMRMESHDGFNYQITPYPFCDLSLKFSIKGKKLDTRTFSDDEELRERLNNSSYETLDFTIGKG